MKNMMNNTMKFASRTRECSSRFKDYKITEKKSMKAETQLVENKN